MDYFVEFEVSIAQDGSDDLQAYGHPLFSVLTFKLQSML